MRVDPAVAHLKFEQEVESLSRNEATLRSWGVFVIRVAEPSVDVMFVPRRPLVLSLPTRPPPGVVVPAGPAVWMAGIEIPLLAGRAFGVRFGLDDYDQRAPSVGFCDPWTWEPIPYEVLLRASVIGPGGPMNVILGGHPSTGKPFLCIRGVREYHEHPQHSGDDWALYRASTGLFTLVQRVWQICVRDVMPNLAVQPHPNKVNIQVNWQAEP